MRTPNGSQWNIGCVGSPMQNFRIGPVHFIFLCVDFIPIGSRFSVEYGLKGLVINYRKGVAAIQKEGGN